MDVRQTLVRLISSLGYNVYTLIPQDENDLPFILVKVNTVVSSALSGETNKHVETVITINGNNDLVAYEEMEAKIIKKMIEENWIHISTHDKSINSITGEALTNLQTELVFKTIIK